MFCSKCGTQMPDTAQFCPSCGAPNKLAQAGGATQQPVQQPIQQPVQQPAYQQQYQQPPYQQQPQMAQRQWQAQGAAYGAAVKAAGKSLPIAKIVAVVAVLVVGVFAAVKFTPLGSTFTRSFGAPEDYYQSVEKSAVKKLSGTVSSTYDNFVRSSVVTEDQSLSGSIDVQLGDEARTLLVDLLGSTLDEINEGDDLKWLKTASIDYEVNRKDDLGSFGGKVLLNGTGIASLNGILEFESGKIWISIPELSERYFEMSMEDMELDDMRIDLGSVFDAITSMDMTGANPALQALPEADVMEKLIEKYLNAALDCIENVEKTKDSLTVEGVTADYTAMITTIDGEAMEAIVKKVGPMLKEDKDIKEIIIGVMDAMEEDGEQYYNDFLDAIDEMLADADDISEDMTDDIIMTVYTDNSDEVHGRTLEFGDYEIKLLMPEKGGKFGLEVSYSEAGEEMFRILGSGTRKGSKLTGQMDLDIEGEFMGVIGLEEFDDERLEKGELSGAITFQPSAELLDMLSSDIPDALVSILEDIELRLDMETARDKFELALTASTNGKLLISASVDGQTGPNKNISRVSNSVAMEEWAEDITLDKLEKIVDSIERAGVPEAYTELLDMYLDSAF